METKDLDATIAQLIALHGDEPPCNKAEDWRAIFQIAGDGPVRVLNLLKFEVETEIDGEKGSGAAAYNRYSAGVAGAFARSGGERLFFGRVGCQFAQGEPGDWDAAILTRYPSAQALAEMWLDPEFVAAHQHRVNALKQSQALFFPA